jgi:hypothetical protein
LWLQSLKLKSCCSICTPLVGWWVSEGRRGGGLLRSSGAIWRPSKGTTNLRRYSWLPTLQTIISLKWYCSFYPSNYSIISLILFFFRVLYSDKLNYLLCSQLCMNLWMIECSDNIIMLLFTKGGAGVKNLRPFFHDPNRG